MVFGGLAAPFPDDLTKYPAFAAHGRLAALLAALIALHLAGALYHQWALRDGLMSRMGFGRRQAGG